MLGWLFKRKPKVLVLEDIRAIERLEGVFKGSFSIEKDGKDTDLVLRKCPYGEDTGRYAFCIFRDEGCGFSRRSGFYKSSTEALQFLRDNFESIESGDLVMN